VAANTRTTGRSAHPQADRCFNGDLSRRRRAGRARGGAFCVAVANGVLELTDERNTNRNATYRTALCMPSAADRAVLVIS